MSNNESKLLSFLDYKNGYTLHFLNGKKLIHDLLELYPHMPEDGARYFAESTLSFLPIISFLKPGESFGFYIDSTIPNFKLKIEAAQNGEMRTLLLPENFAKFPKKIVGQGRLSKIQPKQKDAYTSIVAVDGTAPWEIANQILHTSYQVHANLKLMPETNQVILLMRLPGVGGNKIIPDFSMEIDKYWEMKKDLIAPILINGNDDEIIKEHFLGLGFEFLFERDVVFKCKCSKEAVIRNINLLTKEDVDSLFLKDQHVSSTCEYCKTTYDIKRSEIHQSPN